MAIAIALRKCLATAGFIVGQVWGHDLKMVLRWSAAAPYCRPSVFAVGGADGRSQPAKRATKLKDSRMSAQKLSVTAVCLLALFSFAMSGPIGHAQQFAYCKADVHRLCAGVQPGGGRLAQCLKAHENEVSIGCAKELKNVKSKMER